MSASSRRGFLGTAFAMPGLASATAGKPTQSPARPAPAAQAPRLVYGTLGKTGMKVTRMSFGCMTTSDQSVIERAVDMGINYFDTARVYQNGNNERMVGAALKKSRNRVYLASKTKAADGKTALADLDTSLRELQTDHLDVWHLHARSSPSEVTPDLIEAQRAAKKAGKIRFAGVSTHFNMDRMLAHLVKLGQTDIVLTTYNFAMRSVDAGMNANQQAPATDMTAAIRAARKAGMGIVAMKALAGGVSRVERGDRLYGANPQWLVKQLKQEGAALAAIKWVLRNESVDTAIVCMTNHEQLEENLRAMAEPYTDRDEKLLASQLAVIGPYYCRMCGACNGVCDKGVPVPDVLRILTYAEGYGQFALARERYLELPEAARNVRCGDCGSCSVACPNGVRVPERVTRAREILA